MANRNLTAFIVKYLIALKELSDIAYSVPQYRCCIDARNYEAELHTMMKRLQDMNLIQKDYYSTIYFTENSLRLAGKYA